MRKVKRRRFFLTEKRNFWEKCYVGVRIYCGRKRVFWKENSFDREIYELGGIFSRGGKQLMGGNIFMGGKKQF